MAQKRMFDKRVVGSDKFADLPNSSKALYFMAGMEADDKGFFQPRRLQKMCGFTDDDFKILIAKRFFITFDSGVMVVTDWNKNNWLDNRRITETEYLDELKLLKLINDKYELIDDCLANAKPMLRENRIEENSIEENNIYIGQNNLYEEPNLDAKNLHRENLRREITHNKILNNKEMVSTPVDRVSTGIDRGINSSLEGYQPEIKENNINNNNINNKENNNINIITKEKFKKPTIEEIKEYCIERNNNIDAETFYDYYESIGWLVGKKIMKDWKACVRTWERKNKVENKNENVKKVEKGNYDYE